MTHAAAPTRDPLRVALWMTGSLLSFCVVALSVRSLSPVFSVFEILALRNFGGLVILGAMALLVPNAEHQLRPVGAPLHLLRNTFHFAGQALWAWGVVVLPLATVFAIEFTTPIWVAIFAVIFLAERMTASRALAIALGFVGALVVLRPGLEGFRWEALAVLAAAFCFGVQITTTKVLTATNSTWTILFWMNLLQLPMNLAANMVVGGPVNFLPKFDLAMLVPAIGVAVSGLTAHFCLTNAFRHGDAVMVVPIDFLRVPIIAIVGWLLYAEALDPFVFLGGAIILGGVIQNLLSEAHEKSPRPEMKPPG